MEIPQSDYCPLHGSLYIRDATFCSSDLIFADLNSACIPTRGKLYVSLETVPAVLNAFAASLGLIFTDLNGRNLKIVRFTGRLKIV